MNGPVQQLYRPTNLPFFTPLLRSLSKSRQVFGRKTSLSRSLRKAEEGRQNEK